MQCLQPAMDLGLVLEEGKRFLHGHVKDLSYVLSFETESTRFVASDFRFLGLGVQMPNVVENTGVCCGIRPRSPPNGRLVNVYDLVQHIRTLDAVMISRSLRTTIDPDRQPLEDN